MAPNPGGRSANPLHLNQLRRQRSKEAAVGGEKERERERERERAAKRFRLYPSQEATAPLSVRTNHGKDRKRENLFKRPKLIAIFPNCNISQGCFLENENSFEEIYLFSSWHCSMHASWHIVMYCQVSTAEMASECANAAEHKWMTKLMSCS